MLGTQRALFPTDCDSHWGFLHLTGEACTSILVTRVAVVAAWKEHHPGVTFQPRPSSLPAAGRTRAVGHSSSNAVCKFFLNTGRCALQDACPFAHEHGSAASALWVAQRKQSRRVLAAEAGNMHAIDGGGMHVKAHRAEVFAEWLLATFGKPAMCSSGGVLDVAGGGSGGLAFALSVLHGVPVTVVDPRPVHVSSLQRKRAAEKNVDIPAAFPDQVPLWFEEASWHLAAGKALLVGMHPDQATDSIVDAALHLGIPFAVVPCCVFPSLLAASRGVRLSSRDQLVAHLLAKRPGEICIDWLPVDGAAQVLYWRGPRGVVAAAMRDREPPWWDERQVVH